MWGGEVGWHAGGHRRPGTDNPAPLLGFRYTLVCLGLSIMHVVLAFDNTYSPKNMVSERRPVPLPYLVPAEGGTAEHPSHEEVVLSMPHSENN